jgi:hypothetical protein
VGPHDADGPAIDRVVVEGLQGALGWGGGTLRVGVGVRGASGVAGFRGEIESGERRQRGERGRAEFAYGGAWCGGSY